MGNEARTEGAVGDFVLESEKRAHSDLKEKEDTSPRGKKPPVGSKKVKVDTAEEAPVFYPLATEFV
jgi:hypothetical protein